MRSGREQLSGQAGEKARGLVTQGLERTAEALANVSKMVGDTAAGIEERLGAEYGDYARRAAGAIENVANTIADKDPDELIDDTRNFVRNSPGIALAGAAVVGFVVARLLKTGLARDEDETTTDAQAGRSRAAAARTPVGELVHELIEHGKAYARAEIGLVKAIAAAKGKALALPVALFGVAFICALAAVTALAVGVVLALARFIGPLAAGFVGMLIFAAIAGGLGWYGYDRLRRDL